MELDRNQDDFDDMQLLAAIDRAWPVPPMTGRLMSREWSSMDVAPETGSLAAPLLPGALPRLRPRRPWQSLARIAAILALMFSGVAAILSLSAHDDETPNFSIAAPSPGEVTCSLPTRSRAEIIETLKEVKVDIAAGIDHTLVPAPYMPIFTLTPLPEKRASVGAFFDELNDCRRAGVSFYALRAAGPKIYLSGLASLLNRSNQSIDKVVDELFSLEPPAATPAPDYQWIMPTLQTFLTPDGGVLAVTSGDIFGNGFGQVLQPDGDSWRITGYGTLQGTWSALVFDQRVRKAKCDDPSIRDQDTIEQLLSRVNEIDSKLPLVATLPQETLQKPHVSEGDLRAVKQVVDAYRGCVSAGFDPYQLTLGTEAFFAIFARFVGASPSSPIPMIDMAIGAIVGAVPSEMTSVLSLDENTALALLAVNPEWESRSEVPAIILVKQNGQWLINQLAIVDGLPS